MIKKKEEKEESGGWFAAKKETRKVQRSAPPPAAKQVILSLSLSVCVYRHTHTYMYVRTVDCNRNPTWENLQNQPVQSLYRWPKQIVPRPCSQCFPSSGKHEGNTIVYTFV